MGGGVIKCCLTIIALKMNFFVPLSELTSPIRFVCTLIAFFIVPQSLGQLSHSPYSQIDGSFEGWRGDTIVKLMNGEYWKQDSYSYQYTFQFMPDVYLYSDGREYIMHVEDASPVRVTPLKVIESQIRGAFKGWYGDTIVELTNGQTWKQSQYTYEYKYAYSPQMIIYKSGIHHIMYVDGTRKGVRVTRLR